MKYLIGTTLGVLLFTLGGAQVVAGTPGYAQLGRGAFDLAGVCLGRQGRPTPEQKVYYCTQAAQSIAFYGMAWPYFARAELYTNSGKYALALADADTAAKLVGEHERNKPGIYHLRCFLRAETGGSLDEALSDCNQSLTLRPGNVDTLDSRAYVEYKMGKYRDAMTDYDAVAKSGTFSQGSLRIRGLVKIKLGDMAAGNADIAAAIAMPPLAPDKYSGYNPTP